MNTKDILQGIKDWAAPKVIYDISAAHNNTKYTDLADALGTNGDNIPQEYRKGGITVRYVQSSDNRYVQYRYTLSSTTDGYFSDVSNWNEIEGSVYVEEDGYIYVITDKYNKILFAIEKDGNVKFGAGVPQQVIDYVQQKITDLSLDKCEDVVSFLNDFLDEDVTLLQYLNNNYGEYVFDDKWISLLADNDNKILEGIKEDGTKVINIPIEKLNLTEEGLRELRHDILDGASLDDNLPLLSGNSFVDILNPYENTNDALVLRGQMHMHTTNSDGWFSPTYQAERYRDAGFDFYAITDHDSYLAEPEKLPITPNPNVEGIIWLGSSFEESVPNSRQHINVYLTDHLFPGKTFLGEPVEANDVFTEYAVNGNSFCCFNHPNWSYANYYQTNYKITQLINAINFVEVWNGSMTSETKVPEQSGTQENNWSNCARCWDILLTMGRKVFGLAVDDCHQNNDFLRGYVEVYTKSRTVYDIWDALVNGRFISYNGDGALNPIKVESVEVKNGCINVRTNIQCDIYFYGPCEYTASEEHPENDTYSATELQVNTNVTSASYRILGNEHYVRCAIKQGYNYVWLQPIIIKSSKKSYLL